VTLALHGKSKNRQWLLVAVALLAIFASIGGGLAVRSSASADGTTPLSNQTSLGGGVSGTRVCDPSGPFYAAGKTDEWHFLINDIKLSDVPNHIHAVFNTGAVEIPLDKTVPPNAGADTKVTAHYTWTQNLSDTLLSATANLAPGTYNNFNLSHAPCGQGEPPQDTLTVTKTANTSFTREHNWSIAKSVDTENHYTHTNLPKVWLYADGSGDETATWTVDVTYDGYDDTAFVIYGDITITNPNDDTVTINSVVDDLGLTGYEDIVLDCEDSEGDIAFPYDLPSLATITCTYSVSFGNTKPAASGTNTATVGWTDSAGAPKSTSDTDGWAFGDPTTEVNKTVNISDISPLFNGGLARNLGSVTAPIGDTFTYTKDFAWADYGADGCGDFTYNNTATIVETEQSASATLLVNVQCYVYETAFAKSGTGTTCFIPTFSRWGWTNPYTVDTVTGNTVTWDLWAAAGQCETSKGTLVGTVTVSTTAGGYVTVTFNVVAPYLLDETHVYVGTTAYPKDKKNKSTVAPGQYTNSTSFANGANVWVIAHAVVGLPDPNFGP
jgi:hypothetical protein